MCKIICVMGKSSSGKDHIYKKLLENMDLSLKNIVMYTTRPQRSGETDGVEYYFTTDENAEKLMADGKVIELRQYNTVYGVWKYFTVNDSQLDDPNGKYLVIGTLEAYKKFCEYFGKEKIMPIYIEVEDGIRLERALKREKQQQEPKYKELCRRFIADCEDFSEEKLQEAGISKRYYNNDDIEECIEKIVEVIKNF